MKFAMDWNSISALRRLTAKEEPHSYELEAEMIATLKVINQMQADGIIGTYAIGGAVGAIFHLEPMDTIDIDVFVALSSLAGSSLISISPLCDYLTARGHKAENEYIVVEGWPVQFLPADRPRDPELLLHHCHAERLLCLWPIRNGLPDAL